LFKNKGYIAVLYNYSNVEISQECKYVNAGLAAHCVIITNKNGVNKRQIWATQLTEFLLVTLHMQYLHKTMCQLTTSHGECGK